MTVLPYKEKEQGKKEQVQEMFDNISPKYDFLNHLLSGGIDIIWRKQAIRMLSHENPKKILDIATGTGDFAMEAMSLKPEKIVGADISAGMLDVARQKVKKASFDKTIELCLADSENLPFEDGYFDAVTVAFGVRNYENLEKGLSEMRRVLRPGGTVMILEFSQPTSFLFKQLYGFYSKYILPAIGKTVSKDSAAYTYLPESVEQFPYGQKFLDILTKTGFKETICRPLTFGISSIYMGRK